MIPLAISLDKSAAVPLKEQLADELRDAITSGRLRAGQKLPSLRALAEILDVSKSVVSECYEQLISEGLLTSAAKSGTYVACDLLADGSAAGLAVRAPVFSGSSFGARIEAGRRIVEAESQALSIVSEVEVNEFPLEQWRSLLYRVCMSDNGELLQSTDIRGLLSLREAVAQYLQKWRGIVCDPEEVIVTGGSTQAINLACRLLINEGDTVAFEDPGHSAARRIVTAYGAQLLPVRVDAEGLVMQQLESDTRLQAPKFVYATPGQQLPCGVVLSPGRRQNLLDWSDRTGAYVLEDDCNLGFLFGDEPTPALKSIRPDRVVYVGTFSTSLFPSIRTGYMVVPSRLSNCLIRAKSLLDRPTISILHHVLADFMKQGGFEKYVRKMRTLYEKRFSVASEVLQSLFGEKVSFSPRQSGLYMTLQFSLDTADFDLESLALSARLPLSSTAPFYCGDGRAGEFVFGYSRLPPDEIERRLKHFAALLDE